jgi:hypothetical protein
MNLTPIPMATAIAELCLTQDPDVASVLIDSLQHGLLEAFRGDEQGLCFGITEKGKMFDLDIEI